MIACFDRCTAAFGSLRATRSWLLFLALSLVPGRSIAQDQFVVPRLQGTIQIDGVVDEAAWDAIPPLPAVMQIPTFNEPPSERTEMRLTYDDEYLYFSCRNYDRDIAGIRATSLRRDDGSFTNDWCVIILDTFNDKETTLLFGVSAGGVRTDLVITNDGQSTPNFSWSTFWDGAAHRNQEGWFAEIRIPFSSLRFQDDAGRVVMGVIAWRRIARKNELIIFPAIPPRWGLLPSLTGASRAQEVVFEDVHRRTPLYVTPYGLGGVGRTRSLNDAETAYDLVIDNASEAGLDVKYGITNNLTLDLTVNTDFAQVEADNQVVNLTRFSLFFPERRLFFQERASVFDFSFGGVDRLFHSRRIGLVEGKRARIFGGARLVGRVGAWDVGFLDMQTDGTATLPSENFGVVRLRRQVFNPNSYVGGIVTSRATVDGGYNAVYGLDGIVRPFGEEYLTWNWAQSFDDADAGGVDVFDRSFARLRWERRGIDGFTYGFDISRAGDTFNPEMGFLSRSDYVRVGDNISYGWRPGAESILLRHTLTLNGFAFRRNAGGRVESAEVGPQWAFETKAGHILTLAGATIYEDLDELFSLSDDTDVPAGSYTFHTGSLRYQAPNADLFRPNVRIEAGSFFDGWRVSASFTPTWNTSRNLLLSGTYSVDRVRFSQRDQAFTAHVVRGRSQVMVNHALSGVALIQYNSAANIVLANFRIRYNPREGQDLYLVYNELRNTDRFGSIPMLPVVPQRTFLVKYSHTFTLALNGLSRRRPVTY